MTISRRIGLVCGTALVVLAAGCAGAPSRSGLVAKLEQRNALDPAQAVCVANGLYDGVPDTDPAIRALSTSELREAAKPDNAGKVSADALEVIRAVIGHCVPDEVPSPAP